MVKDRLLKQQYWGDSGLSFKEMLGDKELVLFLDYDGTLAPIKKLPSEASMDEDMREILNTLSQIPKCHVVIISGRTLRDLKEMVHIPKIIYVGNHGFEVEGVSSLNLHGMIPAQYFDDLASIKANLTNKLSAIKGLWIEDKGIILTVHYRPATEKAGELAQEIFQRECNPYTEKKRIAVMSGKKVLEIRPPLQWTKGEAALVILQKMEQEIGKNKITTIYVGDDVTDEDAFQALNPLGVTIRVGNQDGSHAQYFLNTQIEVATFLKEIAVYYREDR